jgi:predicted esterase
MFRFCRWPAVVILTVLLGSLPSLAEDVAPLTPAQEALVRQAAWGGAGERDQALAELAKLPGTPAQVRRVEAILRGGRTYEAIKDKRLTLTASIGADRQLNVQVLLPADYDPVKRYPLMVAIGGGPTANEKQAKSQAVMMLGGWSKPAQEAGWIVAAMEDTASVRKAGKDLRYHILHADQLRPVLATLRARLAIDPDRIHVTGISLGSNYALAYAAAHPDWFAGIAPVSTEGESREFVLRNLNRVSVFTLEGAKDKNIRGIEGPRAMAKILDRFGYRHRYDEDPDKGHEGFFAKYPAVLQWLSNQPRPSFPREVLRVAHPGIVMPAKRFYWVEADTHQAAFQASVRGNVVTIQAARARRLTLHLADRLLNLDEPIVVKINGQTVYDKKIERSLRVALEDAVSLDDPERFATARVTVEVPDLAAGEKWLATLAPEVQPGPLAFWEDYAATTLKEERRKLPAELEPVPHPSLPAGGVALQVKAVPPDSLLRPDDLLVAFDGEPFFAGADGGAFLRDYLWRTTGKALHLKIIRAGAMKDVMVQLE